MFVKIFKLFGVVGILSLAGCEATSDNNDDSSSDTAFCFTSRSALDYRAELALAACNRLLADPKNLSPEDLFEAYFNRGLTKREIGDLEGSKTDLQHAVELGSDRDDAIRMLAWTFRGLGEYRQSVELYTQAIKMAPNNWQGYLSRCVVLGFGMADHRSAVDDCQKAISLGHISDDTIFFTSHSLNQIGSFRETVELIDEHSDRDTVSARVYEEYILALIGLNDKIRAQRALEAAKSEYPSDNSFDELATSVERLQ